MKSLKNLLVPAIVFVVLVIFAVGWFLLKPKDEVEEEFTSLTILDVYSTDIADITVDKKSGDSITFSSSTDDQGMTVWNLIDDDESNDDFELSNSAINSYVTILSRYISTSVLREHGELSEYGLDNPDFTITINCKDGATHKVYIGNQTYDMTGCYVKIEGDEAVYTVAAMKRVYAAYSLIDFLSTQLLDIDFNNLASVSFDRKTDGASFTATCSIADTGSPVYFIVNPYNIKASAYFENLVEYVATLEISQFIEIDDSELAEYGLDDPAFNFVFTLRTGEEISIQFSQNLGGNYYGKCSGIDRYFVVNEMQINGLETPLLTLLNNYITYYMASEMSSISGEYNGSSFTYDINVDMAMSDGNASAVLNGRNALITNSEGRRSYAAILFESLVCIDVGGVEVDANPAYEPIMSLTYVTKDFTTTVVEFVPRDSDSYYVFMNGEYSCFYVYSRELFRDGGTDTFSYGAWAAYELCETAIDHSINGVYDIPED